MKMKQFAAWMLIACLLLAGCQSAGNAQGDLPEATGFTDPLLNAKDPGNKFHQVAAGKLMFQGGGRQRIVYDGAVSQVRYITSADQLPDYEVFQKYDGEFFQTHGLVLVTQSVGSGSLQLEIESILVENGVAQVTLKSTLPGDVGTADMATWLVWVEVDAGLDLQWEMGNATTGNVPSLHTDK